MCFLCTQPHGFHAHSFLPQCQIYYRRKGGRLLTIDTCSKLEEGENINSGINEAEPSMPEPLLTTIVKGGHELSFDSLVSSQHSGIQSPSTLSVERSIEGNISLDSTQKKLVEKARFRNILEAHISKRLRNKETSVVSLEVSEETVQQEQLKIDNLRNLMQSMLEAG